MVYSYTQISQYLRCPRSYRYRYLDGWREKETRAAMAFGHVLIHDPGKNLQIKILRSLPDGAEFVAYMDAIEFEAESSSTGGGSKLR